MKTGFIGIGNIGKPCARHILEKGFELVIHDLDKEAAAPLLEQGGQWADDAQTLAAQCDVVILSLPGPAQVGVVVAGENGLLDGARPGTVIVDLSTVALTTTRDMHNLCDRKGVHYLDCPVSGGNIFAEMGELTLMPAGEQSAFEKAKPLLQAFGKEPEWLGESGTGTLVKLINNQVFLCSALLFQEGLALAAKAEMDLEQFYKVLKNSSAGFYMPLASMIMKHQWEESNYDLLLAEKDVGLALETARSLECSMPVTAASHQTYVRALADGLGKKFFLATMETVAKEAGIEIPPVEVE